MNEEPVLLSYEDLELYGDNEHWLQKECDRWWFLCFLEVEGNYAGNWVFIGADNLPPSYELDHALFGSLKDVLLYRDSLPPQLRKVAKTLNLGDFKRYENSIIFGRTVSCHFQHSWPAVTEMVRYWKEHPRAGLDQHQRGPAKESVGKNTR